MIDDLKQLGKQFNSKLGMDNFKIIDGQVYKLCTKCLQYKPMTDEFFPKRSNAKCGYDSSCKECHKQKDKTRVRVKPFNDKGELYCLHCKTYKPITEFYPNASDTKNRNYYSNYCKECESYRHKEYRETHTTDNIEIFFRDLATGCRGRAYRSNKFKCNITKEDLINLYNKQNGMCALSGRKMTTIKGVGRFPDNASVDRIVPGGDYSLDNIRLVCNQVNVMRLDLEDNLLFEYCKDIINHAYKNKQSNTEM